VNDLVVFGSWVDLNSFTKFWLVRFYTISWCLYLIGLIMYLHLKM